MALVCGAPEPALASVRAARAEECHRWEMRTDDLLRTPSRQSQHQSACPQSDGQALSLREPFLECLDETAAFRLVQRILKPALWRNGAALFARPSHERFHFRNWHQAVPLFGVDFGNEAIECA
jgi:hypothetical protein